LTSSFLYNQKATMSKKACPGSDRGRSSELILARSQSGFITSGSAPARPSRRPSKLDPFKTPSSGCWKLILTAAQVCIESGRKALMAPTPSSRIYSQDPTTTLSSFLKLAFAPGECAQVDWAPMAHPGGETFRPAQLLCHGALLQSARCNVEFTVSQTWSTFLLPPERLRRFRLRAEKNHGRQFAIGRAQTHRGRVPGF